MTDSAAPFPPLFTVNKHGKLHQWRIWVKGSAIHRSDGNVDGKQRDLGIQNARAMNVGRSNSVSAEAQARVLAERMWVKQLDKKYAPGKDDVKGKVIFRHVQQQKAKNGRSNRGVKMWGASSTSNATAGAAVSGIAKLPPMLCPSGDFEKNKKHIVYPCVVQPKLDGLRCIASRRPDGTVSLQTRGGYEFVHLEHIRESLTKFFEGAPPETLLDGELYAHTLPKAIAADVAPGGENVARFQFVSSVCKVSRTNPADLEQHVGYWVFDLYNLELEYVERQKRLRAALRDPIPHLTLVESRPVETEAQVEKALVHFVGHNFEGAIVRNLHGLYQAGPTRSKNLIKYKLFFDEEVTLVGASAKTGTQAGAVVWEVRDASGHTFSASMLGTVQFQRELYDSRKKYLDGKTKATIRFNERSQLGIPRFARVIGVREPGT